MSAVTRALLIELFKVFAVTVIVVASILMFSDVIKEAQLHDIPGAQLIHLLPFVVPFAVKTGFHGALVFATCVTYGRFAASNELLAVKSMGISPLKMLWPIPAFALPMTICCAWLHDLDADWGSQGVQSVLIGQADQIAYETLQQYGVLKRPAYTLVAREVSDRKLLGVTLFCSSTDKSREVTITAQEAELRTTPEKAALQVVLRNGTVTGGGFRFDFPDVMEETLPLAVDASETASLASLRRQIKKVSELKKLVRDAELRAEHGPVWDSMREQLNLERKQLAALETHFHYKWANASSCFFLAMLAAPIAMLLRLTDYTTNFFICFLPVVVIYQPLQRAPVHLAEAGIVPGFSVWFANAVIGVVGVWLLRRIVRH